MKPPAKDTSAKRCSWAANDPLMATYHDEEWGRPEHDSRALWEKLILDGFQAGLSWITILRKREAFRKAFQGFHPQQIARYGEKEVKGLLANPGIIRSRAKIEATIGNAKAYLAMQEEGVDFSDFLWDLAGGKPKRNTWKSITQVPAQSPVSVKISAALKERGFKFAGPVIIYAWMQAVGMVNDHLTTCPWRDP